MGTNYYLKSAPCEHCGRSDEPLHIGKSSAGWCFSLHIIPERGLHDLPDWSKAWAELGRVIANEYGEPVAPAEMLKIITERGSKPWPLRQYGDHYGSEADFHRLNHSQRGPNGLARSAIGAHCVGHGAGTWDLIPGEFS